MELFLAQNHPAMTHLPIATAILTAATALAGVFVHRREIRLFRAVLSIVAVVTVLPTVVTGVAAAKGRFNEHGEPYIQSGVFVGNRPENRRMFRHQVLGSSGAVVAAVLAVLGVLTLRGRETNRHLVLALAVLLTLLWGVGGHLGGEELWSPDTFPAFHQH